MTNLSTLIERCKAATGAENQPSIFRAMPGYPWLPCPICGYSGSCEHTVLERARRAHPGLTLTAISRMES